MSVLKLFWASTGPPVCLQPVSCWTMCGPPLANHIWATKGPSFFAVCWPSVSALCLPELGQIIFASWH